MPRIMFGHMMIARWLGPEFAITEAEALELARAYVGWRKHYEVALMDPKTEALLAMIMTIGIIEGPRVLRAGARRATERQEKAAARAAATNYPGGNVVSMPGA